MDPVLPPRIIEHSWVVKNEKQMRLKHSEIQREAVGITVVIRADKGAPSRQERLQQGARRMTNYGRSLIRINQSGSSTHAFSTEARDSIV